MRFWTLFFPSRRVFSRSPSLVPLRLPSYRRERSLHRLHRPSWRPHPRRQVPEPGSSRSLLYGSSSSSSLDNYTTNMLEGLLNGLESGRSPLLRRLVISGMCLEADGCKHLRTVLQKKALPKLQELLMAGSFAGRERAIENNIMEKGVLAVLLALRETSCPVRVLDLSCSGEEGMRCREQSH